MGNESSHVFNGATVNGGLSVNGQASINGVRVGAVGVFTPQDFGAVGDGVADDTAAIMAAISATQSNKFTGSTSPGCFLPAGQYKITQPLVLFDNAWFEGAGPVHTKLLWYGADAQTAITCQNTSKSSALSAIRVGGFSLHNYTMTTAGVGIEINNVTNGGELRDVHVGWASHAFPTSQIVLRDNGSAEPGANFFRVSHFFVEGGVYPVDVDAAYQTLVFEYGGIDIKDASTLCGVRVGDGAQATVSFHGVKVEANLLGVPAWWILDQTPVSLFGCGYWSNVDASFGGVSANDTNTTLVRFDSGYVLSVYFSAFGCMTKGIAYAIYDTPRAIIMPTGISANPLPCVVTVGMQSGNVSASGLIPAVSPARVYFSLQKDVQLAWSDATGAMNTVDVDLFRASSRLLKTSYMFQAGQGVATMTKAGTPSDADFLTTPPVGTLVVDTTASKLWARTGVATWKGVVIA